MGFFQTCRHYIPELYLMSIQYMTTKRCSGHSAAMYIYLHSQRVSQYLKSRGRKYHEICFRIAYRTYGSLFPDPSSVRRWARPGHLPYFFWEFGFPGGWLDKPVECQNIEERKLQLVPGKFGQGLYLGAVPLSYDSDNMSGLELVSGSMFFFPSQINL